MFRKEGARRLVLFFKYSMIAMFNDVRYNILLYLHENHYFATIVVGNIRVLWSSTRGYVSKGQCRV